MTITSTPPLSATDAAAIRKLVADSIPFILAGNWDAYLEMFTDDLVFMPPGAPAVFGRRAARDFFKAFPRITAFTSTVDDITGRGDFAVVRGSYTMTATEGPSDAGKWIATFRRGEDGGWRAEWDAWNSDQGA